MTDKRTGGPAFPVHPELVERLGCENSLSDAGMTLRDYFAAKALQGMLAENGGGALRNDKLAAYAYNLADEMLKARDGIA